MKKKYIIIAVIIVAIVGVVYLNRDKDEGPRLVKVQKGTLLHEVNVTGKVRADKSADLSFEKGGQIRRINVDVGDQVFPGKILAELQNQDLIAQYQEAEAKFDEADANLEKLKQGTRAEEINIQETEVQNAKTALEDAREDVINNIYDSYTKADNAVRNQTDQLLSNPSSNPQFNVPAEDQLENDAMSMRSVLETSLMNWFSSLSLLETSSNIALDATNANQRLKTARDYLTIVALVVNALEPGSILSQTAIDGYKTDVAAARTDVNLAIANLSGSEEALRAAQSKLALEESELVLKQAGATNEEILASEARKQSANATVNKIAAEIEKTRIRAPFAGKITKVDVRIGENIAANTSAIALVSDGRFEIEAFIPETDIAPVSIEDRARITLDAYTSDLEFEAFVTELDLSETVVEGVSTYKTTLLFSEAYAEARPGMTADIYILTNQKENTLYLPQRSVVNENGKVFVRTLTATGEMQEVAVVTGMKDSDGNIEILEGLTEGQEVVLFVSER